MDSRSEIETRGMKDTKVATNPMKAIEVTIQDIATLAQPIQVLSFRCGLSSRRKEVAILSIRVSIFC